MLDCEVASMNCKTLKGECQGHLIPLHDEGQSVTCTHLFPFPVTGVGLLS